MKRPRLHRSRLTGHALMLLARAHRPNEEAFLA